MPSGLHQSVIEFVEAVPGLLPELLRRTSGQRLPEYANVAGCSEAANIKIPIEHRADAVRAFTDEDNKPVLVTVVEVQLRPEKRGEETKPWVWPVFVAEARRQYKCPAVLLVIVADSRTAEWARPQLDLGLGCSFITPLVVDVSQLEPVVDASQASTEIGLALLAALNKDIPLKALDTLSQALAQQAKDEARQYAGLMLTALRGDAHDYWRKLMTAGTYAYQNEYAEELLAEGMSKGMAKGKVEGEARAIVRILDHRGIAVSAGVRERIEACSDASLLDVWVGRALDANSIDDVFAD